MDSIDLKDYYPRGSYLDGVYAHYSSLHAHCQWAAFVHIISDTTELHRLDLGLSSATAPRLISEPQRQLKAPAHSDHPNSRLSTADYRLPTRLPTRLPSPSLMATTPPSVTIILTQFTLLSTPGASGTMVIVWRW